MAPARKTRTSSARLGRSASITIEFELSRSIDAALQDVQTRVAQAARRLPREMDPPIITKNNPEDQPILWLALAGNRPPTFLADYIRNVLIQARAIGAGPDTLEGLRRFGARGGDLRTYEPRSAGVRA